MRFFITSKFREAASRVAIGETELHEAISCSQSLGGGVFKTRLKKGEHRGLLLGRREHSSDPQHLVYVHLFAKKDKENIPPHELKKLRQLAVEYAKLSPAEVQERVRDKDWFEINADLFRLN